MKSKNKMSKIKYSDYLVYILISLFLVICLFAGDELAKPQNRTWIVLFEKTAIAILLSVSLSFVVGFLGELSLGHAGFMCIGAYIGGKASVLLEGTLGNSVINLVISMIIGGAIAALAGAVIGLPALRLKGDYLAIVTLAFCEIVHTLFRNSERDVFGGAFGLETPRFDKKWLFYIAFIIVMLTIAVFRNIIRSKHGRAVTSIRDNEIAARATGINVTKYKMMVFIISSFFAGVAGVLYSFSNSTVQDKVFTYNYSIEILVIVVLGGMGNLNGSIISAILITFLNEKLTSIFTDDFAVLQKLIYSIILIAIVIYRNAPGLRGFREKYNFRVLKKKLFGAKNARDISDLTDDEGDWDKVPTKIPMDEVLSTDLNLPDNDDSINGEVNE